MSTSVVFQITASWDIQDFYLLEYTSPNIFLRGLNQNLVLWKTQPFVVVVVVVSKGHSESGVNMAYSSLGEGGYILKEEFVGANGSLSGEMWASRICDHSSTQLPTHSYLLCHWGEKSNLINMAEAKNLHLSLTSQALKHW
jgi:hypothetical protein